MREERRQGSPFETEFLVSIISIIIKQWFLSLKEVLTTMTNNNNEQLTVIAKLEYLLMSPTFYITLPQVSYDRNCLFIIN